jgi:Ankyrin repeats (3 copies)
VSEENNNITASDPCPDEQELKSYASGEMASTRSGRIIGCHLEFCPSCRSRVENIRKTEVAVDEAIKVFAQKLKRQQEKLVVERWRGPQPGAIWRTVPESDEELLGPMVIVIQVKESGSLSVAEISEDIAQAIHTDMVLEPQVSGLRFRFMIRGGNVFETTFEYLKTFAGQLPSALTSKVVEFCGSAENFDSEIPLSKYKFGHDPDGTVLMHRKGITSGMLVTQENDPRLSFLDSSKHRGSYLSAEVITTSDEELSVAAKAIATAAQKARGVARAITKRSLRKKILALAAVLAVIVVGLKGSEIVLDRSMEQLRSEHSKQVEDLKAQFATAAKEKAKELAGLHQEGEELKSKVTALQGQNTELKTEMEKIAGSITQSEKKQIAALDEAESLKSEMDKIESENAELKKKNMELAASNYESGRQLAEARAALQERETKIAAEREPQKAPSSSASMAASESKKGPREMASMDLNKSARDDLRQNKEVLQAARSGDLTTLRRLVKDWRSTDFSDQKTGAQPLLLAAFQGHLAVVEFLLDKGARVNASDADGKTALILAATKGYRDMVELLLKRGADPRWSDKGGRTAVYWALANGHKEIAETLRSSVRQ